MKIRRMTVMLLVMMLFVSSFACSAESVEPVLVFNARSVMLNPKGNVLIVEGLDSRKYGLYDANGTAMTEEKYVYLEYSSAELYRAAEEKALNKMGVIDGSGNVVVPMEYGRVYYHSDRWILAAKCSPATQDNYDTRSPVTYEYCLIDSYDVYYCGRKVATLKPTDLYYVEVYGDYLYACTDKGQWTYYDKNMKPSGYAGDNNGTEYEETKDGIYHRGSGQKAFAAGCTLTDSEVEKAVWEQNGSFLDLQGNTLFTLSGYMSFSRFEGNYALAHTWDKTGIIDRSGRVVIAAEYDEIPPAEVYFPCGYQTVIKDGKVGFVNLHGEVTCDFGYSEKDLELFHQQLFLQINHSDGSVGVLSAAVGELSGKYYEVQFRESSPIFAAANDDMQAGVLNLYGEVLIPFDGTYTGTYNFQLSEDGSVVVAKQGREYSVYHFTNEQTGACTAQEAPKPTTMPSGQNESATSQDAPAGGWTCSKGHENIGKFCGECGEARPVDNSWICSNGHAITTKFCPECGEARPADKLKCSACGYEPAEGTSPKFCGECGKPF